MVCRCVAAGVKVVAGAAAAAAAPRGSEADLPFNPTANPTANKDRVDWGGRGEGRERFTMVQRMSRLSTSPCSAVICSCTLGAPLCAILKGGSLKEERRRRRDKGRDCKLERGERVVCPSVVGGAIVRDSKEGDGRGERGPGGGWREGRGEEAAALSTQDTFALSSRLRGKSGMLPWPQQQARIPLLTL